MSIYNVNGTILDMAYDISGEIIEACYDVHGTLIFSPEIIEGYPIENVPTYTRPRTLEVAEELDALDSDWQSFVFVTDPHYPTNKMHSQAVALYLLSNTSCSYIFLGGDYCEGSWNESRYRTFVADFKNSINRRFIHALIGNHELFGSEGAKANSLNNVYNDFLLIKTGLHGDLANDYYYFDNEGMKTRYVVLNTSDASYTTVSETQLSWVEQAVQLPDSTWSVVVITHIPVEQLGDSANSQALINAIKTCNGSIVGNISGHDHVDALKMIDDSFYRLTLMCDRFEDDQSYAPPRETGTITENAVTVVSFNTKTKQVVARRIGAGLNNQIQYSYAV